MPRDGLSYDFRLNTVHRPASLAGARETERVRHACAAYQEARAALNAERFKFIGEAGVNLAMTRRYGRAPRGQRVGGPVPPNGGANVTRPAALGSHGVEAVMTSDGATDAEVFRAAVAQVLRPTPRPWDIVSLDNLRAHQAAGVREAIAPAGAQLVYVPPDSPDLSPLERCWSKRKTALRTAKGRTREALERAIAAGLATMTGAEAPSGLHHCGYA
jgi:transposase